MRRVALGTAGGVAVGLVLARLLWLPASTASPAPTSSPPAQTQPALDNASAGVTADDLASLAAELRAELRAGHERAGEPVAAAVVPAEDAEPSPEAAVAAAAADELVERAIESGHWTEADVERLRTLQPQLAPDDLGRVLSTLTGAINDQVLVPSGPRLL